MTPVEALVERLAQSGVTFRIAGSKVLVKGGSHLSAEDREFLRAHRDELVALLTVRERRPVPNPEPEPSLARLRLDRLAWARSVIAHQGSRAPGHDNLVIKPADYIPIFSEPPADDRPERRFGDPAPETSFRGSR